MSIRCDVAIVGGGPAGAVAGRLLARWGYRVVLVEAAPGPRDKVGEVLAPSARPMLDLLGLAGWLDDSPDLARRCPGIASDWGGAHLRDFLREPGGHGWILDRLAFEDGLARRAVAAGVDWRWGHRLRGASCDSGGCTLIASAGGGSATIRAAFALDASGRAGALARRLGARRRTATRRFALDSAHVAAGARPRGSGWVSISAGADGWLYCARGPGERRHGLSFGDAPPPAARGRAWEAGFSILDRVHGDRWIAAGDAAAAFDPLTSQGIPNALASGLAAARAVRAALDGDGGEAAAYAQAMLGTWSHSLAGAQAVYASEQRWPAAPFWRAAHGPPLGLTPP